MDVIKPIQSMQSMGTPLRDQGIFKLSNSLIRELIEITEKTTSAKSPDFYSPLNNLKLLQKLISQGVDITFNNEDLTCLFSQNSDIFKKAIYNNFFLFLTYDKSTCQAAVYNTSLEKPKGFIAAISLNNSLLCMIGSKRLTLNISQELENFLHTYHNEPQSNTENKYENILQLNAPLLEQLTVINTKNEFHKPYCHARTKRLALLQELMAQGTDIVFENESYDSTFWIHKEEPDIYQNALYDTLLSLLSYRPKYQTIGNIHCTFSETPRSFIYTLWCNPSFLHIVITKQLASKTQKTLQQFLSSYTLKHNYEHNTHI